MIAFSGPSLPAHIISLSPAEVSRDLEDPWFTLTRQKAHLGVDVICDDIINSRNTTGLKTDSWSTLEITGQALEWDPLIGMFVSVLETTNSELLCVGLGMFCFESFVFCQLVITTSVAQLIDSTWVQLHRRALIQSPDFPRWASESKGLLKSRGITSVWLCWWVSTFCPVVEV